jgi:hypothetical protein
VNDAEAFEYYDDPRDGNWRPEHRVADSIGR